MLAFPSTYSVGITSLGYQVVWATLAQRPDVDVRRLFTDQGDPPHRSCDLFGLSLSWELDGPVLDAVVFVLAVLRSRTDEAQPREDGERGAEDDESRRGLTDLRRGLDAGGGHL